MHQDGIFLCGERHNKKFRQRNFKGIANSANRSQCRKPMVFTQFIDSKRFIRIVAELMRWDMERTYRVSGELYGKLKIVKFDLVQAVKIS